MRDVNFIFIELYFQNLISLGANGLMIHHSELFDRRLIFLIDIDILEETF